MRGFTEAELIDLATIDMCEWFFWTQHEHVTGESLNKNEELRQKAVTELKETFNYSDEMIREGVLIAREIAKEMSNNLKQDQQKLAKALEEAQNHE